jgi:hypothetical protein
MFVGIVLFFLGGDIRRSLIQYIREVGKRITQNILNARRKKYENFSEKLLAIDNLLKEDKPLAAKTAIAELAIECEDISHKVFSLSDDRNIKRISEIVIGRGNIKCLFPTMQYSYAGDVYSLFVSPYYSIQDDKECISTYKQIESILLDYFHLK